MKEKKKIAYLEYLRILSMFCVIIMHVSAGKLSNEIDTSWQLFNVITSISFIAVPVFFMISGVVLLNSPKTISISYIWKTRLPKLIIPLIIWSIMVMLSNYCSPEALENGFAWENFIKGMLMIPSRNIAVHLWFMYFLIPIYIISPFLKILVDHLNHEHVKYLFILWGIIVLLSTINGFMPSSLQEYAHLDMFDRINFIGGYLFYFFAGFYLHNMKNKISNVKLFLTLILCSTIVIVGTSYLSMRAGNYVNTFQSVNYVFMVVMSICIFLLAKQNIHPKKLPRLVTYLATLSFSVYLMHNIFISILSNYIWNYTDFIGGVGAMVITLIVCVLCNMLLSSIRPLCYLFTGITYKTACESCNIKFLLEHKN